MFEDLKNSVKTTDAAYIVNQCESKLSLALDLQKKNARFMKIKGKARNVKETDYAGFAHRG